MQKVPTSIQIDRAKKEKAAAKIKSLGFKFQEVVDRFLDFINDAPPEKIYNFMKNKKLLILLFLGGAIVGFLLPQIGKIIEMAMPTLEMIDKVMK